MTAAPVEGQHWPKQNAAVPSQDEREITLVKHCIDALCQLA
jgi:hypothetical protein